MKNWFLGILKKNLFCKYKLCFKAYHYSKLKTNHLLGEVEIELSSVNPEIQETFHVDFLRTQKKGIVRSSQRKCSLKKAFLKNFAKFTGQHLSRKHLFYRTSLGNCFGFIAGINISKVSIVGIMPKRKNIQVKNFFNVAMICWLTTLNRWWLAGLGCFLYFIYFRYSCYWSSGVLFL